MRRGELSKICEDDDFKYFSLNLGFGQFFHVFYRNNQFQGLNAKTKVHIPICCLSMRNMGKSLFK